LSEAAIDELLAGAPADDIPASLLRDLTDAGLVGRVGRSAWWLPYRVQRWPVATEIF